MAKMKSETIAITVSSLHREGAEVKEKFTGNMLGQIEAVMEELLGGDNALVEVVVVSAD